MKKKNCIKCWCEVRPPQNEGAHTAHVWMQTEPCVYAMEKKVPTHPLLMQTFLKIKKYCISEVSHF